MARSFNYLPDKTPHMLFADPPGVMMGPSCFQDAGKKSMQLARLQQIEIDRLRDEYGRRLQVVEQSLRCNTVRLYGVAEEPGEDPYELVLDIFRRRMHLLVGMPDLQSCYRSGQGTPRYLVVRFTTSETKEAVLKGKSQLKGSSMGIFEDLCPELMILFRQVSGHFGKRQVWVENGVVKVSSCDQTRLRFQSAREFENYLKEINERPLIIF